MTIPLNKLNYSFTKKPLLIGGMAMEYYGLRKAGIDIDFIADEQDVIALIKQYPDKVKNLYGDLGVCPLEFEIWRSIHLLKYNDLIDGSIEEDEFVVISLEKLLLMKTLDIEKEKYLQDTKLIAEKINNTQYENFNSERIRVENLLVNIANITYIEKTGPKE